MTSFTESPDSGHTSAKNDVTTWFTISEAVERFDVSRSTLRRRLNAGEIEGAEKSDDGRSEWRIPGSWLIEQFDDSGHEHGPGIAQQDRSTVVKNEPSTVVVDHVTTTLIAERLSAIETALPPSLETSVLTERLGAIENERDRINRDLQQARSDLEAERSETRRTHTDLATAQAETLSLTRRLGEAESETASASARADERAEQISVLTDQLERLETRVGTRPPRSNSSTKISKKHEPTLDGPTADAFAARRNARQITVM